MEGISLLSLHAVWNEIPSWLKAVDHVVILMMVLETISSFRNS